MKKLIKFELCIIIICFRYIFIDIIKQPKDKDKIITKKVLFMLQVLRCNDRHIFFKIRIY